MVNDTHKVRFTVPVVWEGGQLNNTTFDYASGYMTNVKATYTYPNETAANMIEGGDWGEMVYKGVGTAQFVSLTPTYVYRTVEFTYDGVTVNPVPLEYVTKWTQQIGQVVNGATLSLNPANLAEIRRNRLQSIIKSRTFPRIVTTRKSLPSPADIREVRARDTLRQVIGEMKWKGFLKNGFVSIRAKSGLVYQIFPGYNFTKVYEKGVLTESLCVVLRGNFPPTDSIIARYLLILNNEEYFRKLAIRHEAQRYTSANLRAEPETLVDIARRIA